MKKSVYLLQYDPKIPSIARPGALVKAKKHLTQGECEFQVEKLIWYF